VTLPTPPHVESLPSAKPGDTEKVPFTRLSMWMALGVVLVAGLYLYFRYAAQIVPILGSGSSP
jgi:hypothetical protein